MAQDISPQQLEMLLAYAAPRLHTTPQALREVYEREGLDGLMNKVGASPDTAAQIGALLQQPDGLARLLQMPAVQQLLRQLGGG